MPFRSAAESLLPAHARASGHDARAPRTRPRKRLCILVPSHWEQAMGGAEYQVRLLIERLQQLGRFEIHYITRKPPPPNPARGYEIHGIGKGRAPAGAYFLDAKRLWNALERIRPDVIYQRVACGYTGVAARYAKSRGCRLVWHVASDQDLLPVSLKPSNRKYTWRRPIMQVEQALVGYAARRASAIVVQTSGQAELLKRFYGRADCTRVSNFHPRATEPLDKPAGVVRVGWIGNMKAVKRPETFLRLARDLSHLRNVELVMLGQQYVLASARAEMERQLASLPNLKHLGQVPPAQVNRFLAQAHVLVNTSSHEGFSNTFIQAWQRDVVVVSLAVNPDGVFDDDRYGIYAGDDYSKLCTAITELAQNPRLREEIASRARLFADERFSERNIDMLADILDADPA